MKKRIPAVAGYFYPAERQELKKMIEGFIQETYQKEDALGGVSPHAGYIYSGATACKLYAQINIPSEVIILCPNHTGLGAPYSLWSGGSWVTPLGEVEVSYELANLVKNYIKFVEDDNTAHLQEHSAEVQLPFLQYFNPNIRIIVISVSPTVRGDKELVELCEFGKGIGKTLKENSRKALIVASSDMNHYESHNVTTQKDMMAIREIERLSEEGLFKVVKENNISMCGYAPTISMISACKEQGATTGRLIGHTTSAETSGDYKQVVGYAGISIK